LSANYAVIRASCWRCCGITIQNKPDSPQEGSEAAPN